ncbi:two-component sensor histidine kinase [Pseudoalteromonas sp. MMG013]|uniref:ATP-binding protein n=1 Tax=Pseudoalteromonas sp. MMG013 TaxID=2822687 RepID=UPI001B361748|nr:two-component sensor histidine kinase [Pseudoalteromonas sp. MMG013]
MKKLYLYLLTSALVSIVVLGWLIDTLNQQTAPTEDSFGWQSTLTGGFALQIARQPEHQRASFAKRLSADFDVTLTYKQGDTLALPHELKQQMALKKELVLEDELGFYLLKTHDNLLPDYLELRLQKPELEQSNDVLLTLLFYAGVCGFMWFILSPLAKRLSVLTEAAKQFASGDLSARIKVNHFTYIKDVELTFNRMANQIDKLLAENKLMASSLSHDIRTPVACLRFGLDAAIEEPDLNQVRSILVRMENDLDQMEDMLASYLSFATLEQKAHLLTFESTQAQTYIAALIDQIQPKLTKADLIGSYDVDPQVYLYADLHWLARAITNLLSNACEFASRNILVRVQQHEQLILIDVEDDGPGIAPNNWHKVFSPFFQEQNHRNRDEKGYGLGLAIVAKVVDWHHGKASVSQSETLGGAKFTLSINCKPNKAV